MTARSNGSGDGVVAAAAMGAPDEVLADIGSRMDQLTRLIQETRDEMDKMKTNIETSLGGTGTFAAEISRLDSRISRTQSEIAHTGFGGGRDVKNEMPKDLRDLGERPTGRAARARIFAPGSASSRPV